MDINKNSLQATMLQQVTQKIIKINEKQTITRENKNRKTDVIGSDTSGLDDPTFLAQKLTLENSLNIWEAQSQALAIMNKNIKKNVLPNITEVPKAKFEGVRLVLLNQAPYAQFRKAK